MFVTLNLNAALYFLLLIYLNYKNLKKYRTKFILDFNVDFVFKKT